MAVVLPGYTTACTSVDGLCATSLTTDQPSIAVSIGIAAFSVKQNAKRWGTNR